MFIRRPSVKPAFRAGVSVAIVVRVRRLGPMKSDRAGYTVAVVVVERAMRLYDARGREAALAYYNSPESVDGEWYVFIFNENEKQTALALNPEMLGEDMRGDEGVEFTGYRHGEAIAGATGEKCGSTTSSSILSPAPRSGNIPGWYGTTVRSSVPAGIRICQYGRRGNPGE